MGNNDKACKMKEKYFPESFVYKPSQMCCMESPVPQNLHAAKYRFLSFDQLSSDIQASVTIAVVD